MVSLDQVDHNLQRWVEATLGDIPVTFAEPHNVVSENQISLYLKDVVYIPLGQTVTHATTRPTVQLSLNYLVTTWSNDPILAHRYLEALLLAAIEHPTFSIQAEAISLAMWQALQIPPRPAFVLNTILERDRPRDMVPVVRQPPIVQVASVSRMQGMILGPNNVPLADVRVMLPNLQRSTTTDADGIFRFEAVPELETCGPIRVQAKGLSFAVLPDELPRTGTSFIIHVNDLV